MSLLGVLLLTVVAGATEAQSVAVTPSSGVVAVGNGRGIFSFTRQGKLLWRTAMPEGSRVVGDVVVAPNSTVYVRTETELVALTNMGTIKWRRVVGLPLLPEYWCGPVALTDSSVLVLVGDGEMRTFTTDGDVGWRYLLPDGGTHAARPRVASDGTVYVRDHDSLFAVGADGHFDWKVKVTQ